LEKASPIEKFVAEKLKSDYENKMKVLDSEQRSRIERIVYLQILDNAWREHLYTMDNLKTGINLRGYNQKDPLVEYKKESYNLFLELIEDIKIEAIKTFSKIQFENEQDSSDAEHYLDNFSEEREHESVTYRHEETLDEDLNVAMKAFSKTPKRNEPCPCGSGKKYKDCCAKSGPKKGLFAK
ncbi:SEC-C metal-binding domain-containing protein, partial [Helicobacter pylori]